MDTKTLTAADIDAMEAGTELDRIVAEKVMGYSMYHYDKDYKDACYWMLIDSEGDSVEWKPNYRDIEHKTEAEAWAACPKFSTDIAAAFEVLDKVSKNYRLWFANLRMHGMEKEDGTQVETWVADLTGEPRKVASAPTPALAICRAALKASIS